MDELKKKTIIVIGGTGGIGQVIVRMLLDAGSAVSVGGTSAGALRALRAHHAAHRERILAQTVDVTKEAQIKRFIANTITQFGHIDGLVNCAGVQAPIGSFASSDMHEWQRNLEVNLVGTARMMHAVLPHMMKRRSGSIINFSGGGSTGSRPHFSAYAVAKTGVVRLTEVVADEVKEKGIRVNAIAPGAVNTRMLDEVIRLGKKAGEKELREARERKVKGGTPPERAAELVRYLLSDASRGITGKLMSAVWDPWQTWTDADIKSIQESDRYTLRRITT